MLGGAWCQRDLVGHTLHVRAGAALELRIRHKVREKAWGLRLTDADVQRITGDGGRVMGRDSFRALLLDAGTALEVCSYTQLLRKECEDARRGGSESGSDAGCPEAYRSKRYLLATAAGAMFTVICNEEERAGGGGSAEELAALREENAELRRRARQHVAGGAGAEVRQLQEQNAELQRVNKALYRRAREDQALLDDAARREDRLKDALAALKCELADVHRQLLQQQQQQQQQKPSRGRAGAPPAPRTSLRRRSPSPGNLSADSRASSRASRASHGSRGSVRSSASYRQTPPRARGAGYTSPYRDPRRPAAASRSPSQRARDATAAHVSRVNARGSGSRGRSPSPAASAGSAGSARRSEARRGGYAAPVPRQRSSSRDAPRPAYRRSSSVDSAGSARQRRPPAHRSPEYSGVTSRAGARLLQKHKRYPPARMGHGDGASETDSTQALVYVRKWR